MTDSTRIEPMLGEKEESQGCRTKETKDTVTKDLLLKEGNTISSGTAARFTC